MGSRRPPSVRECEKERRLPAYRNLRNVFDNLWRLVIRTMNAFQKTFLILEKEGLLLISGTTAC